MSDIDDELLALAGGDVSSDEEEDTRDVSRESTPSESPKPATAARETPASKSSAAAKRAAPKKTSRDRDEDDSEEEGEASSAPGSPDSQQSAPMDESNSDSDSPQSKPRATASGGDDDDVNKYPVEGLFVDLAEKEQIMSMREIEREQILAERREENERIRQNRMLRQLVVNQDKDNKKRKASAADLEDSSQRKTMRVRTKVGGTKVGETSSGMDSLRRAREERHSRMQQRERENGRRKERDSPSRLRGDERDGGSDSEGGWAGPPKPKSGSPEVREAAPTELRDFERIRVGRSRFAEVCYYPNFEESITGCYVRINIGPDPTTRQDVYRMAVIKGFTKGRPYAISDHRGHQIVVETYVKAAHGKAQREWPFIMCSDRGFTEAEFNRYKQVCLVEGINLPKKPALVNKIDDINKLVNRRWTELELADKLNRQNTLRMKFSGADRDRLVKQVADARARGDEERAAKLQDQLDNLEVPRLAFKTSLKPTNSPSKRDGTSSAHKTQQERLAQVNAENRRRNTEAVRKAQMAEILKSREIEARIERGEHVEEDLSRRVKTRMKFMHDAHEFDDIRGKKPGGGAQGGGASGGANGSGASTPKANGTPGTKPALPPHIAKLQEQQRNASKNGIPMIHKPLMDDDIIGALDLDIDVEIE